MLLTHATLATICDGDGYGLIENGAMRILHDRIDWIGSSDHMPPQVADDPDQIDCRGKLVTPGLIDCHTHLVHAGDRAEEFEMRCRGTDYQQIAAEGGGIMSTVAATRAADRAELVAQSLPRLRRLMAEGVTTIEIKSGYGLDTDNEIKMLQAADTLAQESGVRLQKTFLGAHALPTEYHGRADAYIDQVCNHMLPAAVQAGVVDAVDAFCENIAFSVEQVERVFDAAQSLGLPVRLHAEQLGYLGGAKMAAARGALSVDHLEYLPAADAGALAEANTVAVLLPGAFYFLGETRLPPVEALRQARVPIAVATDANPGSSPLTSILLAMNMACVLFSLTPQEALRGTTINAARALGLEHRIGSLAVGKSADLVLWDTRNPASLVYHIGRNPAEKIMLRGEWITSHAERCTRPRQP